MYNSDSIWKFSLSSKVHLPYLEHLLMSVIGLLCPIDTQHGLYFFFREILYDPLLCFNDKGGCRTADLSELAAFSLSFTLLHMGEQCITSPLTNKTCSNSILLEQSRSNEILQVLPKFNRQ